MKQTVRYQQDRKEQTIADLIASSALLFEKKYGMSPRIVVVHPSHEGCTTTMRVELNTHMPKNSIGFVVQEEVV